MGILQEKVERALEKHKDRILKVTMEAMVNEIIQIYIEEGILTCVDVSIRNMEESLKHPEGCKCQFCVKTLEEMFENEKKKYGVVKEHFC